MCNNLFYILEVFVAQAHAAPSSLGSATLPTLKAGFSNEPRKDAG